MDRFLVHRGINTQLSKVHSPSMPTSNIDPKVKVAVVQAAPVLFDREATIDKLAELTSSAVAEGAALVVFPEAFVPCYPRGFSFGMVVGSRTEEGRTLWERYVANAVEIPGEAATRIGDIARTAGVMLAVGVTERDGGTLYCTVLYFGADGHLLGKHRKLKPTGSERLIWGEGDGSTLISIKTGFGVVGGLICWENYMPLARVAMYQQGVDIYLAPTADSRDGWHATLQHIALEGRCYVIGCNQYVTKSMVPKELPSYAELKSQPEVMCRGGSAVISPLGEVLAGPVYGREEILYAELDMAAVVRSKLDFDAVGHYARPDVFDFSVHGLPTK